MEKLQKARRRLGSITLATLIKPDDELHYELREVIKDMRSAMDWLEDTETFEDAHDMLDRAGKLAREYYPSGCEIPFRDGSYWVECAVDLAHNRIGLSTGFLVEDWECSICGNDPEECPHIVGRVYDDKECLYIPIDGQVSDVSLVSRPNLPDCRITSISILDDRFHRKFGEKFIPGMSLTCDQCLTPCSGVSRAFEEAYPSRHEAGFALP